MRTRVLQTRRLSLLLIALCCVIAAELYLEYSAVSDIAPVKVPADRAVDQMRRESITAALELAFSPPPVEQFAAIAVRPLFSDTRRPSPLAEKTKPKKAEPPPKAIKFSLVGIVLSADDHMALLQKKHPKELILVAKGERIDGWLVETIMPDRVVFRNGKVQKVIELRNITPTSPHSPKPVRRR